MEASSEDDPLHVRVKMGSRDVFELPIFPEDTASSAKERLSGTYTSFDPDEFTLVNVAQGAIPWADKDTFEEAFGIRVGPEGDVTQDGVAVADVDDCVFLVLQARSRAVEERVEVLIELEASSFLNNRPGKTAAGRSVVRWLFVSSLNMLDVKDWISFQLKIPVEAQSLQCGTLLWRAGVAYGGDQPDVRTLAELVEEAQTKDRPMEWVLDQSVMTERPLPKGAACNDNGALLLTLGERGKWLEDSYAFEYHNFHSLLPSADLRHSLFYDPGPRAPLLPLSTTRNAPLKAADEALGEAPAEQQLEVILVDVPTDPGLQRLLTQTANDVASSGGNSLAAKVTLVAQVVCGAMGGVPAPSVEEVHDHVTALREKLQSDCVPLGSITVGGARHRAILFKVLAACVGVHVGLVRSGVNVWNVLKPATETGVPTGKDGDMRTVVDLVWKPGALLKGSEATKYKSECGSRAQQSSKSRGDKKKKSKS